MVVPKAVLEVLLGFSFLLMARAPLLCREQLLCFGCCGFGSKVLRVDQHAAEVVGRRDFPPYLETAMTDPRILCEEVWSMRISSPAGIHP